jgi:hypothetical protein
MKGIFNFKARLSVGYVVVPLDFTKFILGLYFLYYIVLLIKIIYNYVKNLTYEKQFQMRLFNIL